MRTALALRTSIVTAALTGALLIPAAGSAFAAPATAAVQTAAGQTVAASDNDRYEGEPVYIGEGLVAVLRNKAEGPEAWIRAVGPDWKPGDTYMVRVVTKLDRTLPHDTANGLSLELTKAATAHPVLVVTAKNGSTKSYPLPAGQASTDCRVGPKGQPMGAGVRAELYVTENGPKAVLFHSGDDRGWTTLDRTHPALPDSEGIIARIVNPSSATPVFEWKTQGGHSEIGRAPFPAFPKGCKPSYEFTGTVPVVKPTAPAPAPAKPQTVGQTAVVPKGPVAAGAELPVAAAEDTDKAATWAAGVGLMAAFGALGASVHLRRRRDSRG
ncbi:hypothetical protein [Streptomyces sp. NBC_01294]|uniref:hypothetical protein n=1 Tax=Streptomyces sp. NBC_01294 TaxID=2903815 RepID=UPI002DDC2E01|nr:hypothetical protein [Streptomyces sp. NBC_01294]WRZ57466.1 hypothetical protein OG534_13790 [Streptomyces sp. NBC_01294]